MKKLRKSASAVTKDMEIQVEFKNLNKLRVSRPEKFSIAKTLALSECGALLKLYIIGKMQLTPLMSNGNSQPGGYPAIKSGNLSASLTYIISGDTMHFGSNLEYGKYLENGTSKMAARPFLSNTFSDQSEQIRNIIIRRMRQVLLELFQK